MIELKRTLRLPVAPNCELRPIVPSDVTDAYVDGLNDPIVSRHLVTVRERRQTHASVAAYVAANAADESGVLFGIHIDEALRGTVRLHALDRERQCGTIGIVLFDRSYWRQGWGARAVAAVVDFAVASLGLRELSAGMYDDNLASQRTFAAAGFERDPAQQTMVAGRSGQVWRLRRP